ncbi:MAG: rubrerythrin family protein [Anaerolineales bacterium]|nr:rubrerythrin family protein [Anaerolineae bacterium]PWB56871.1 MAG: rubrerythrin family protein [Anaerolineales bacterium]
MDENEHTAAIASLNDEINGAYLYDNLAQVEKDSRLAEVYHRMADVERRHATEWVERLKADGVSIPEFKPSWRSRTLAWAARRFGVAAVLPTIMGNEQKDSRKYAHTANSAGMAADEASHNRLLNHVARSMKGGMEGGSLAQLEGRHRAGGGNALRAAVLGANDGLVSNLSLVMGVAGAALSNTTILVTGMAGLLAGAISMALGEWLSVQSSRELYKHQIGIEKAELMAAPQEEAEELALIYEARGLPREDAQRMAQHIISDPSSALETLSREELNVDPSELGGSAWEAALTSFFLFSVGAIIPVLPYIFLNGYTAVIVSTVLSAFGLFAIGSGITLFTGRSVLYSGFRQVLFGLVAAGITFGLGKLIGGNLAG